MGRKYEKWVKKALELVDVDCETIADIGAGDGWTHRHLYDRFPNLKKIYAVEPCGKKAAKIKQAIVIDGEFKNFNVPEKVDLVFMSASFHHCIEKDLSVLFSNIRKISKDKVRMLFVTDYYIDMWFIIRRLIKCLQMGNLDVFAPCPVTGNNWRTKPQLIKIFKDNGFDIKFHKEMPAKIHWWWYLTRHSTRTMWNTGGLNFYYAYVKEE